MVECTSLCLKENKINTNVLFNSLKYLSGFGNEFASEALPDALPKRQVSRFNIVDVTTRGLEIWVLYRHEVEYKYDFSMLVCRPHIITSNTHLIPWDQHNERGLLKTLVWNSKIVPYYPRIRLLEFLRKMKIGSENQDNSNRGLPDKKENVV